MKSLLYIGNKLKDKGYTATAIDVLGPLLEDEGYSLRYASSKTNKLFRILNMLSAVFKYRKQIDYVLIDTYSTLNFQYVFWVSQFCKWMHLRYVPILHGGNLPERLHKNPKMCRRIFAYAYKNVAPSKYVQQAFEQHGFSNVVCIPNAIQIKQYPFQTRTFKTVNLLWVRSFATIYNPFLAVKILKELIDHGIHATLGMVGPDKDGSLHKTKQYAASLGVDVVFTGKLSKKNWIDLSNHYNVFLNTSNFDNMPVSVIEAMALGLPVISTHVGGMPFLIENAVDGILVAPDSERGFVAAIKQIIDQPKHANDMTINARKKAEQFDWDIVKHQWITLLQ